MLVVLVALHCSLAKRGRGRQNYRTEEDRRETRRRLSEQRDPRRGGWSGRGAVFRAGEVERRGQSLKQFRKPLETSLAYEKSIIFRDLVRKKVFPGLTFISKIDQNIERKKVYDDKQHDMEVTTEHYERDTSTEIFFDDSIDFTDDESNVDNLHSKELSEVFGMINEEGSGEIQDTLLSNNEKEGKIVTINGRKAVIKKRKRGQKPENNLNPKPLSEITNTKITPNSGNLVQDNNVQSTNYSAKYPRRFSKAGRQFRVKKRRRQEAATRGGNRNMKTEEETDENILKLVMQNEENSNEPINIQNEPQQSFTGSFKIQKPFEDLTFPVQKTTLFALNPSPQLPFNTIDLSNINFSQFDAQFGQSIQLQPTRSIFKTQNIKYPTTGSLTNHHKSQSRQPQPSPERSRSMDLFRGHPVQKIKMNSGSYSFTTRL